MRIAARSLLVGALVTACTAANQGPGSPLPNATVAGASSIQDRVDERQALQLQCLEEAGFPSSPAPMGGVRTRVPPGQEAAFDRASTRCLDEALAQVPYIELSTADQYARLLHMAECLEGEGFDIPEVPSEATWVDGGKVWHPYGFVAGVPQEVWFQLNETCPQF